MRAGARRAAPALGGAAATVGFPVGAEAPVLDEGAAPGGTSAQAAGTAATPQATAAPAPSGTSSQAPSPVPVGDAPGTPAAVARRRLDRAEAWASLRATVLRLAVVAAAAAALLTWVFALVRVEGAGMYPTAGDGDLALVWRLADAEADLVADTVVAYEVDGVVYVGRIVAVAGDEVEVTDEGYLLVNGNVQDAVTLEGTYPSTSGDVEYPLTLAEGELWVLGDGRADAIGTDSRTLGPVAVSEVVGTVVALLRLRGI